MTTTPHPTTTAKPATIDALLDALAKHTKSMGLEPRRPLYNAGSVAFHAVAVSGASAEQKLGIYKIAQNLLDGAPARLCHTNSLMQPTDSRKPEECEPLILYFVDK